MAYMSTCQIIRKIPAISGCGFLGVSRNNVMPTAVRAYTAASSFARNAGKVLLLNGQQQSKKIPGPVCLAVNQIRSSSTGDHVRLWQIERIVSAAFIVLLPACILTNNAIVDVAFSILTVMHAHWGLEAVIMDYARPAVVGPILPKVAFATLYLLSIVTLAGLMALVYNGPGVGGGIKQLWAIGRS